LAQERCKARGDPAELFFMSNRKSVENPLSTRGKFQQDTAAILFISMPLDEPKLLQAVGEFNGGMMAQLQALRQFADGDKVSVGKALDSQQSLVLLRGNARPFRGIFAESEKLSERMTESGEILIFGF
jgi:hypothetical protein